eukprot:1355393-Rhodomonas_salina.1
MNSACVQCCACSMPCVARMASSRPESSCHCLNLAPSMLQSWEPSRWRETLSLSYLREPEGVMTSWAVKGRRSVVHRGLAGRPRLVPWRLLGR